MNLEELKTLIAKEIKSKGLNGSLPDDAIDRIKNKIVSYKNKKSAENIPDVVSELDIASHPEDDRKFPEEEQLGVSPASQEPSHQDNTINVDAGAVPTEQPSDPTMGYTPELPEMLKKAEPSELIVFDYNEVSESGENLSFKPLRLMDDPDVKKSMHDLWMEQGKTKADVYVAKFEKIGQVEFNYTDGTSKFIEKASMPDHQGGQEYKDNPYKEPSMPQIEEPAKEGLETYVKSSIDLENVVHDIVMNILKDSLLSNTERADNADSNIPAEVEEDISAPRQGQNGYGAREDQLIRPMEENKDSGEEEIEFKITMSEIVESEKYRNTILPEELNEKINSGDKSMLVNENEVVQEWEFKGEKYYTPVGRISKDKGYVKS